MQIITLTTAQQSEVATLQSSLTAAQTVAAPYQAAVATATGALRTYIASVSGMANTPVGMRNVRLSTDGTSVVVG
jgi:hypothetical protein